MITVKTEFFWDYNLKERKAGPNWRVIVSLPVDETCYISPELTCNATLAGEKLDPWWGYYDDTTNTRTIYINGRVCETYDEAYQKAMEQIRRITEEIGNIAPVRAKAGAKPVDFIQSFDIKEVQQ